MKPRNLLVAAVLLLALSGVVWWAKRHPQSAESTPAASTNPKLADIPDAQIESIDIAKKDSPTIALRRQGGKWAIASPQQYPADQDTTNTLASSLSPVTADSVVEDAPSDASKYGLTHPSLIVTVHEKNTKTAQLTFGDDVPAGSLVYARVNGTPKVYAVSSSVKSSLDKTLNDLRDKRMLTFDSNGVTRVDLASAKTDVEFGKNNQNEWQILKPQPYRADNFEVEELLRKLADAKMDLSTSADDQKKSAASFDSGQEVSIVKVSDASGTQTMYVRKNKDDFYAKSSVVSGAYKISADLGKELGKSLEDFRNKKIFDFGFSDPNKIEIQQGPSDKLYSRSGTDWKLNGTVMDAGSLQSFIDKLRDLTATKFVTTGFTTPSLTVAVTSNDGKRIERAEFGKTQDGYIVRRGNEPSLYQVTDKAVNDILDAGKAIKPTPAGSKK